MTKVKFLTRRKGVGAKSGMPYDIVELSDGSRSYVVTNRSDFDFTKLKENDQIEVEFGAEVIFGKAQPTLVKVLTK